MKSKENGESAKSSPGRSQPNCEGERGASSIIDNGQPYKPPASATQIDRITSKWSLLKDLSKSFASDTVNVA